MQDVNKILDEVNIGSILEIYWLDSASMDEWADRKGTDDDQSFGCEQVQTVGMLEHINANSVVLVGSSTEFHACNWMAIPRACIRKVTVITPPL